MPAAAKLLHHGRVLRAADGGVGHFTRNADIAADTLADVVDPAFSDLVRQKGVGDGGPRRADQVHHPALDLGNHGVWRGEAPNPNHGLARHLLDETSVGLLKALLGEA